MGDYIVAILILLACFGMGLAIGINNGSKQHVGTAAGRRAAEYAHCLSQAMGANLAQTILVDYMVDNQFLTLFDLNSVRSFADTADNNRRQECKRLIDDN